MTKYYYITNADSNAERTVHAENDEAVMIKLKEEFGEYLVGLQVVYTRDPHRTVWLE